MPALRKGTEVFLRDHVRVGIDTGERFDWGGRKYDWHVVGEHAQDQLEDMMWVVESTCGPHATMNGGGYDYTLRDVESGIQAIVRTTHMQPESMTFARA